jgi:hypothetical protein
LPSSASPSSQQVAIVDCAVEPACNGAPSQRLTYLESSHATVQDPKNADNEHSENDEGDENELGLCPVGWDIDDGFWEEAPSNPCAWYVNIVPERYKWEPTIGIGELEWHELVQEVAIRARRTTTDFENEKFPVTAARRLLAILTVQNLRSAWLDNGFATLFANRFSHANLVSKAMDAVAEGVNESYAEKKQLFIDKGLVGDLLR